MDPIREELLLKLSDASWKDWRATDPAGVMEAIERLLAPKVLTNGEGQIMRTLVQRAGATVSRVDLTAAIYDFRHPPASNSLEVLVSRVRAKLTVAGVPVHIETIRGVGYRLEFGVQR